MSIREQMCDSLVHEYKVLKQLLTKLPEGCEDYRISPTQRSTIEVLRYLTLVGPGALHAANDNGFAWYAENEPHCAALTLTDMPSHIDGAIAEMRHLFAGWTDEEFATREVSVPGLGTWTIQTWVLNTVCKWLPAYKLQIHHHAKACGNTDLGTRDAWFDDGESPPPEA